ncbi:beta-N-acetylglucosaminidase domain-containing protein [Clostridium sp.]|uniref:beta-N-acetylglucosaminidase domain-containing protein n=1 Tax=Clostridium sp. TaxID=1506 RepID=UPI003F3F05CE
MKRRMIKRLLTTAMAAMFMINGLIVTKVDAKTDGSSKVEVTLPNLNPTPKNVDVKDGTLTLTKTVNIKGIDVADEDAIRILTEFLSKNNIQINESYNEASTTLIIGESSDEIVEMDEAKERLGVIDAESLKDEGYVLAVDADDTNAGTILIEGKDGDGTFYGVKTLTQLAVKNNENLTAKEVVISDEATMSTRGIVEGFYGSPWTHADRLNQIEFYGEHKMNTYIYAPKDDPYHRNKWREPYPESEMARMSELIETSNDNKVDFVFGISPGIDIRFDGEAGEADFQALMNKCESLYQMGVRSFAIYFDDISDKSGVKQANVLNRFNDEFVKAKGDVKPLITVPTEYDTFGMGTPGNISKYTSDFSSTLDKDIMVMWTGNVVVSEKIDLENAQFVNSIYGKRMGIWWNYPVTDYMTSKLALGPIYGVDKALEGEIDFFTMNPMEHAELSKITLATGADYSWNTAAYDYDKAWNTAIELLYGELAPEMKTFANHSTRMEGGAASTGRYDAPEVRETMDRFISKLAKGQDATEEIEALRAEFDNMINAANKLKAELPNEILSKCSSNLDKLKLLGENDKVALDMLLAQRDNNESEFNRLKAILNSNMSRLNSGSKVSEKTALAFINEALSYDPYPTAGFKVSKTLIAPGEEITITNTSSISAVDMEWTFEGANIETSTEQNPTISYAKEGIYTVSLKAKNVLGEDEVIKEHVITVSNLAGEDKQNLSIGKTATASGYTAASESPDKAIDGKGNTKWCAVGNRVHTLTIDLGDVNTISNVIIKHAEVGGESAAMNTRDYRLEVSMDGVNFKEVAKVVGNTAGETNDQIPVSKARYVRLNVDKPTQGNDSATRIFEVEVMGLEGDVELPPVYEKPEVEIVVAKPTNLRAEGVSNNTVALTWEAPSHVEGLVGYEIYKDGKIITEVSKEDTSYNVEGLKSNTIYGFKVVSKYSNGEKSKPVSVNTRTTK